ncbi:phosphomannomutase/phosphoglucomutase, partial [Listeria monocytogenes]|nr:phosphomannomutase/phosphoglucomutase [Listeria monocytogenes]
ITASHLHFMYNGLKLFTKSGVAEHEDIDYIVSHADKSFIENGLNLGKVTKQDLLSTYAADLTDKIRAGITDAADKMKPLQGSHIIV